MPKFQIKFFNKKTTYLSSLPQSKLPNKLMRPYCERKFPSDDTLGILICNTKSSSTPNQIQAGDNLTVSLKIQRSSPRFDNPNSQSILRYHRNSKWDHLNWSWLVSEDDTHFQLESLTPLKTQTLCTAAQVQSTPPCTNLTGQQFVYTCNYKCYMMKRNRICC